MGKTISIADIVRNIRECAEHSHKPEETTGILRKCPFCGYESRLWATDNFGWPECPNCGAT